MAAAGAGRHQRRRTASRWLRDQVRARGSRPQRISASGVASALPVVDPVPFAILRRSEKPDATSDADSASTAVSFAPAVELQQMIRQTVARIDLHALKSNYQHIVEYLENGARVASSNGGS